MPALLRFHVLRTVVVAAVLAAFVVTPSAPARAVASSAFVRVNQLGYASATKRAYLMASGAETGATFAVKNSGGTTVYTAPIGANLGSWSSGYPDVYALDFDTVADGRQLHHHGHRADRRDVAHVPGRHRPERLRRRDGQRRLVLPERTRRRELHPFCTAHRARHTSTTPPR